MFVRCPKEYPGYRTQGESLPQLRDCLIGLYPELASGEIPRAHKVGDVVIA